MTEVFSKIARSPDHAIARFVLLTVLLSSGNIRVFGDIGRPATADYDEQFGRAVDLLEAGSRPEAEKALEEIRVKSGERAWEARIAFVLAGDDLRRKDFPAAVRRLRLAPAAAIGLESYRNLRLGEALEAARLHEQAARTLRTAFETEEPFARRVAAARELASALEKGGDRAEAAAVLAKVAETATGSDARAVALERMRLALAAKDRATVRAAARHLLLSGVVEDSVPAFARRVLRQEESRLTAAEKAKLGVTLIAAGSVERGVRLIKTGRLSLWPADERAAIQLALARGESKLGQGAAARRAVAAVPRDGTAFDFEARLFAVDLDLNRAPKQETRSSAESPVVLSARRSLSELAHPPAPAAVRIGALARLIQLDCDAGRFEDGLAHAQAIEQEDAASTAGFEPLWKLAWALYLKEDFAGARSRIEKLADVYSEPGRRRRLTYWRARCLEHEGRREDAAPLYESLAAADPADLYAVFARRRTQVLPAAKPELLPDPSTATATFRRTDELLLLRMFEDAAAEARLLPPSRGRDLRLSEAEFALGRFPQAADAAHRAFPELGTPLEARVPDGWRRLFYPIEEKGFLADRAKEFGIDPALLRGLVRQESVFEPRARSRAGALGLMQLTPATAKSLSRSVLRARYRQAFLYDPGTNARLGTAYFKRLLDRFGGKIIYALAAYNGGPTRMARVLKENSSRDDDEVFESHPAYETRDYVRRVMLYAESYRELYR